MSKKSLILLLGAVALVFGAFLGVRALNAAGQKRQESEANDGEALFSAEEIVSVDIAYDGETVSLAKEDGVWAMADEAGFPMNQDFAQGLADKLLAVSSTYLVQEGEEGLDAYGLSQPRLTVACRSAAGEGFTLYVGDYTNFASAYYARTGDGGGVYLIDMGLPTAFFVQRADFVKLDAVPAVDIGDVTSLQVAGGDVLYLLRYDADGSPACYTDSYTWFYTGRTQAMQPCDQTAAVAVVQALTGLQVTSCAAWGVSDFSEYGLDLPAATAVLRYTEHYAEYDEDESEGEKTLPAEFTLSIGGKNDGGQYYCRLGDSAMVSVIDADAVEKLLGAEYASLQPQDVFLLPLRTVEAMRVTVNGETTEVALTRTETTDEDGNASTETSYRVGGVTVDPDGIEAFYDQLLALKSESTAETESAGETLLQIDFARNTATFSSMTLTVSAYDANFCRVSFAGRSDWLINKRDAEALVTAWEAL